MPLSEASIVRQGEPNLNAFLAAATALLMSSLSPSWISAITSPFVGLIVLKDLLLADVVHSLLIKIYK